MITSIDVVDSAVKIGLGAMISGLATYWLAKTNHDKTIEKERAQRRRDLLEAAAQQVASLDQAVLRYWQTLMSWIELTPAESPSPEGADLARLRGDEISEASKDFTSVEAKLLLLGEVKCNELFREYARSITVYQLSAAIDRTLQGDELRKYRQQLREKREKFFAELSKAYKRV
jgi:hypothetical protein